MLRRSLICASRSAALLPAPNSRRNTLRGLISMGSGVVGVVMHQLFLRWNQGQDLRQALITIAISIILADQMLAHFGGVAEDIAWPRNWDTFVNLRLYGIVYTETRIVILVIAVAIGVLLSPPGVVPR